MAYNLHPLLSSFPVVLFTLLAFNELLLCLNFNLINQFLNKNFTRKFSILVAWLGFIASILTLLSGYLAAENASLSFEVNSDFIATHQSFAKLFLFLQVPLLVFLHLREQNKFINFLYQCFLFATVILVLYVGSLGASLVFVHGAGVNVLRP